jgi:transposase-like protein
MITDKLASYGAAKRDVMPGVEHRQHKSRGRPDWVVDIF